MGDNNTQGIIENYIILNQNQTYRLAFSYVHNKDGTLDIVQESIHKAVAGKRSLHESDSVRPWLYKVVVNTVPDFLHRKKREAEPDEGILLYGENAADDYYGGIDLKRVLGSLPDLYRSIAVLRHFEGLTLEEIVGTLNGNLSTVKTRFYKSLKLLRAEVSETE